MRARTAEASEQIQRLEANSETTIKDCASQILAFNERNEGITKELQEIVAERAAAKAELKKKNAIVEDAVATITELRNELQCAEEDAEGTIVELENKVAAVEAARSELEERNKQLAMDAAKGMAQNNAQVSSLEKALSESHWELDSIKRHVANLQLDKQSMEDRMQHLQRDNESLKKVEKNMGSFLKSVMGNRGTPNADSAAIVSAVAKGVKPLKIEKAAASNKHKEKAGTSASLLSATSGPKSGIRRGLHKKGGDGGNSSSDTARSTGSNTSTTSTARSRESASSRSINGDDSNTSRLNLPSVQTGRSDDSLLGHSDSEGGVLLPSLTSSRSASSIGSNDTQVAADVIARTAQFLKKRQEGRPSSRQGGRSGSGNKTSEVDSTQKLFTNSTKKAKKKKLLSHHASKENSRNGNSRTLQHSTRGSGSTSTLGVRALKQRVRRATSAHPNKRSTGGNPGSRSGLSKKNKKEPRVSRPGSAPARQTPKRV